MYSRVVFVFYLDFLVLDITVPQYVVPASRLVTAA